MDAIKYQVLRAKILGIVKEMQNSLFRTGYSTVIRESQDASCALLDQNGFVVAQHLTLPGHMGVFPASCKSIIEEFETSMSPGDAYLVAHPYMGGSGHAPDFAVFTPIFVGHEVIGFCASMAHKSDIGGPAPGSCWGGATDIFGEGLQLPPVRLEEGLVENRDVFAVIGANSRAPELVLGDMRGQVGAARLGERRIGELVSLYGSNSVTEYFSQAQNTSELRLQSAIDGIQNGSSAAERFVDTDAGLVSVRVTVEKTLDRLSFDFASSDDQTEVPANIRPPMVRMACAYALIALLDNGVDINSGIYRTFDVLTRPGSIVDPIYPAPVNTYNPTVHAVVDAVIEALTEVTDAAGRADGCASRSIVVGGQGFTGESFVQYEIFGGGAGAYSGGDGASGTTVNHTNGRIASIEIIESEFPVELTAFEMIRDSGGAGLYRGGLGFRREYLFLTDVVLSLRSTRHHVAPRGARGGHSGAVGRAIVISGTSEARELAPRESAIRMSAGDRLCIDTPGGGGYGDPKSREDDAIRCDVENGYVSPESAVVEYGRGG